MDYGLCNCATQMREDSCIPNASPQVLARRKGALDAGAKPALQTLQT